MTHPDPTADPAPATHPAPATEPSRPGVAVEPAPERPPIDPERGLSAAEVAARIARGEVNAVPRGPSRTVRQILRANVVTRFNALMVSLGALVLVAGAPGDSLFLGVVILNALIGSAQELRAKRTLDRLALLNAPQAHVVRDGAVSAVGVGALVLDDVIELRPGQQVVADAVTRWAENLELDESLLTGEADAVDKHPGDELLSGSFVVAGAGRAQVVRVGAEAYASRLAEEARKFTLVRSELMADINRIITWVTWLLVPTAALLFVSQLVRSGQAWREAVVSAVAGVVGMVPEGLVLLTSVAFAVGVLRLAQRRTLVQELPAIEILARVDVLCLDKTGTITEGALDVTGLEPLPGAPAGDAEAALAALGAADPNPNATQRAIVQAWPTPPPGWTVTTTVPFSSARKWSGAAFDGCGSWLLGAPEFVLGDRYDEIRSAVEVRAEAGMRVLLLARSDEPLTEQAPADVTAVALVLLEDRIRSDAPDTLAYFARQDVTLKVISGDNPRTVGAVARRAGLAGADQVLDARELPSDVEALADILERTTVFGRVTPHQKRAMVQALQSRGHTVAMTGDGVNDVLALKDADVGIAMASGSEATRAVAQLVLLDSNFAGLPGVVAEGRRVINNIQRVAALFLTKTTYSAVLALLTGVLAFAYPFLPRHLTLISGLTIGIPSFFLALAPNDELVRRGFLARVASTAVPGGLVIALFTMVAYGIARADGSGGLETDRSVAVLVAGGIAFLVLLRVARPWNSLRLLLVATMIGLFIGAFLLPITRDLFELELPTLTEALIIAAFVAGAGPLLAVLWRVAGQIADRRLRDG